MFLTVATWIIHLSKHNLKFYILENVPGIMKRKQGEDASFGDWFKSEMLTAMPHWTVSIVLHNSVHCLVPQSRPRCFFVGLAPMMRKLPIQRRILGQPPKQFPEVNLINFLDKTKSDDDFKGLTTRQQLNVEAQLATFRQAVGDKDEVGICDIARDPMKKFCSDISYGRTYTLRTNCKFLWVLPSESLENVLGARGRF